MPNPLIANKARAIKLLILDVDGVLTDGKIWLTPSGEEMKSFHTHDGMGIKCLQQAGITVAVISSRTSPVVKTRMEELGVEYVYQGKSPKTPTFEDLIKQLNLPKDAVAYVGDDLADLPVMEQVGLSIAVNNAVNAVKQSADWQTQQPGGHGAVREVCDMLLEHQLK